MEENYSTKRIVYMGFLIALSIILTRIFSISIAFAGVEGIRIGIGALPIIIAGIFFGPVAGGLVGAAADFIGFWVTPMGGYVPHFTLTSFLTGFIPGLMFIYVFKRSLNFWTLLFSIAIGQIITSMILVPIFLNSLFELPILSVLIPRLIAEPLHMIFYAYAINLLAEYNILKTSEQLNTIH